MPQNPPSSSWLAPHQKLLHRLASAEEMRRMDQRAIEQLGIPGLLLMENAAISVANLIEREAEASKRKKSVLVCCGKGNNGGDGYALARLLCNRGWKVQVLEFGRPKTQDAIQNRQLWLKFGITTVYPSDRAQDALQHAEVIVDALFGTGLNSPLQPPYDALIHILNQNQAALKVAVDIPSGVQADTGQIMGVAFQADFTVSFQVAKQGLMQFPGRSYCGTIEVPDISIPPHWEGEASSVHLITQRFIQAIQPQRKTAAHKGDFGHLMTLCGTSGMGGAGFLAAYAAIKCGTGLVTACVPEALRNSYLGIAPELMTTVPAAESNQAADWFALEHHDAILRLLEGKSALVLGCGIGTNPSTRDLVRKLVTEVQLPLLIDADGLNLLRPEDLLQIQAPVVLTPHPKELSRLSGLSVAEIQANRLDIARKLAEEWRVVLLLKGANTVIAAPDGRAFINPTGNQGMATGGSGDVLSGMIGAFLAQGCDALQATLLGAWLHGHSADLLLQTTHPSYLSAMDLIRGINQARLHLNQPLAAEPSTKRYPDPKTAPASAVRA